MKQRLPAAGNFAGVPRSDPLLSAMPALPPAGLLACMRGGRRRLGKRKALATAAQPAASNVQGMWMGHIFKVQPITGGEGFRTKKWVEPIQTAGLFVATQYEIPFKLSISTFHVSVMAITPAIATHKV